LGRVITETRTVSGSGIYQFKYAYNGINQLVQTTYPGNLIVKYTYDKYGNKTQTTANDKIVYQVDDYDGLETKTSFLNKYTTTCTLDSRGFKSNIVLKNGNTVLDQFKMNYDGATGNLLSRTHNSLPEETFGYDNLDRLVSVKVGTQETMHIKYADNGNITSKTGIGQYYYNAERPHAVSSVDNTDNLISTQACTTQFNELNKISSIQEDGKVMTIDYGPDLERCLSILKQGNAILRKVTYLDDYEKVVANGVTREFYYLDGDVIVIRENGKFKAYQSFKDNLGSILSVVDENGSKVFSAEYDAWGKQTVSVNTIGLIRGYCGHEMLNDFNLINMNGRVYDPVLGRFLSPDKYVQQGDNSQDYNSYSYCLNNPLKYTDPSGELFGLDDTLVVGVFSGAIMGAMNAAMSDKPIWRGALLGGLSVEATYGIGSLFGPAGSFGHEMLRAGAHALSSGVFNALNGDNFWNGLISGAASSGMGSYAQSSNWNPYLLMASTTAAGGAIAWATGGDFLQGALNGLQIGAFNFAEHDGYDGNGGPGYVKRLPDGTLEAQEPLQEVKCIGKKISPIINVPQEKPLVAVYQEFDILFFVRAAIIKSFSSLLSSIIKYNEKSFFEK
jgi:RHS repeat-associated protein